MRNNIRLTIFFSILPLFLLTGCVSTKTVSPQEKIEYYKPPALSNEILNERIDDIKNLLDENSLSEDRKETAISILKAYEKLKSLNRENSTEKEYRKTVQLLFNSLTKVEQQYFYSGIVSDDVAGKKIIENYSSLKKQIFDHYFAGDFTGVISGCNELMSTFGKSGLTPDLGIVLVEALLKNNMTLDALTVARSILATVETNPDLIRLLADAIELELKLGNKEEARRLYEKLVDNINERNNVYKRAGNLLSEYNIDGSIVDESVNEKVSEIDPEKTLQIEQLVDDVKKLISKKDFSGASLLLIRKRLRAEEGPELEMIDELLKSVYKAEEQFSNKNSNEQIKIDDAKKLIEEEKFEDALEILDTIVIAGGNYEAEKIKKQAIEKLINRERKIAGQYFRKALEKNNIKERKEFLLSAKSIIMDIIEKYPTSPSIDRLNRDILKINSKLEEIPNTDE